MKKFLSLVAIMILSGIGTVSFIGISPLVTVYTLVTGKTDVYEGINSSLQDFYYVIGKNLRAR